MEALDTTPPLNVGFNKDLEAAQAPVAVAVATPSRQEKREILIRAITRLVEETAECTVRFKSWGEVERLQRLHKDNFRDTGVIKFKGRPALSIDIREWDPLSPNSANHAYAITSYSFVAKAAYDKIVGINYKTILGQSARHADHNNCISFPQRTSLRSVGINRPNDMKNLDMCLYLAVEGDFGTKLIRSAELAERETQQQAAKKSVVGKVLGKLALTLKK